MDAIGVDGDEAAADINTVSGVVGYGVFRHLDLVGNDINADKAIAHVENARGVGADVVALHKGELHAAANQPDASLAVCGNDVVGSVEAANVIPGGTSLHKDAGPATAVSQGAKAGGIGADEIPLHLIPVAA